MSIQTLHSLLEQSKPIIMGILNVTPDSFSDGGLYDRVENAKNHALKMIDEGAEIIDIGGESTRPGAKVVSLEKELDRVIPVIKAIREENQKTLLSIDTSKPEVMCQAIAADANIINDVNALQAKNAIHVAAELDVPVCLMHKQGLPETMQNNPNYKDVLTEVKRFLESRIEACEKAGIIRKNIVLDPGFGFGKNLEHNMALLNHLDELSIDNLPVLAGLSRKSMFNRMLGLDVESRLAPSLAAAVIAAIKGASIIRVHDVKLSKEAIAVYQHLN